MRSIFQRKGSPQSDSPSRTRKVIYQRGANKSGYKLDRVNAAETIYFRTEQDRDLAAKADRLAFELKGSAKN